MKQKQQKQDEIPQTNPEVGWHNIQEDPEKAQPAYYYDEDVTEDTISHII